MTAASGQSLEGQRAAGAGGPVILAARGAYGVTAEGAMRALAEAVAARVGRPVFVGYLDGGSPSLADSLSHTAGLLEGARRDSSLRDSAAGEQGSEPSIVIAPVALPSDRILTVWIRRLVAAWRNDRITRTGAAPEPLICRPLAESSGIADALAQLIEAPGTPLTGARAAMSNPAWGRIPSYRQQVFICRGPRCTYRGSDALAAQLSHCLREHGLGDDDVLLAATGCLYPCNLGPVMVVQPDDVWYGHLDADAVERIVESHLVGGVPMADRQMRREPPSGCGAPGNEAS